MLTLNRVTLFGRVGQDPEIKTLPSGKKVAKFSLATNYRYKDEDGNPVEHTDWHNITAWGFTADATEKFIQKGSAVYVEGALKTDSWENEDGKKQYRTYVNASMVNVMSNGKPVGDGDQEDQSEAEQMEEDDLPF